MILSAPECGAFFPFLSEDLTSEREYCKLEGRHFHSVHADSIYAGVAGFSPCILLCWRLSHCLDRRDPIYVPLSVQLKARNLQHPGIGLRYADGKPYIFISTLQGSGEIFTEAPPPDSFFKNLADLESSPPPDALLGAYDKVVPVDKNTLWQFVVDHRASIMFHVDTNSKLHGALSDDGLPPMQLQPIVCASAMLFRQGTALMFFAGTHTPAFRERHATLMDACVNSDFANRGLFSDRNLHEVSTTLRPSLFQCHLCSAPTAYFFACSPEQRACLSAS